MASSSLTILLATALSSALSVQAQHPSTKVVQHEDGLVSFYFTEVQPLDAARLLAAVLGARFAVVGNAGEGQLLTLTLERVSARDALDQVLSTAGLNWATQEDARKPGTLAALVISTPGGIGGSESRGGAAEVAGVLPASGAGADALDSLESADDVDEWSSGAAMDAGENDAAGSSFAEALRRAGASKAGSGGNPFGAGPFGGGSLPAGVDVGAATNPFAEALQRARSGSGGGSIGGGARNPFNPPNGMNPFGAAAGTANPFGAAAGTANPFGEGQATPAVNPFSPQTSQRGQTGNPFFRPPDSFVFRNPGSGNPPQPNPFVPPNQNQK